MGGKKTRKKMDICQFFIVFLFLSLIPLMFSFSPKISQGVLLISPLFWQGLAFGTDAGVPDIVAVADGGLRQHGTDAYGNKG